MAEALEPIKDLLHRVKGAVARPRGSEHSGLRIVREPKKAEIDIVAVHGLGGEGFTSWVTWDPKRSSRPKSWLEELLAKDLPNARIMTYGYMSDGVNYRYLVRNVLYGRALDLVKELGAQRRRDGTRRRPIFFIAHSLGGWIVKRALIISSEAADLELKDVDLSTCGVAFFGTLSPGRPAAPSPLAHVIRRTTSGLGDENKRSSLSRSSMASFAGQPNASDVEWLENQMEAFKAITAELPRLSFHETQKSSEGFVVEKRDSISGTDGTQIGLKATHSDLIKFRGHDDDNYRTFLGRFREMVDKALMSGFLEAKQKIFDLAAVNRPDYISRDFSVPYTLPWESTPLVPRPELLAKLEDILSPEDDPNQLHLSIATLCGHQGTGRATLARHYIQVHEHDLSFVFWIGAESWETVVASYLEFANILVQHYCKTVPRDRVENDLGLTGVGEMLKVKSILQLDTIRVRSVVRSVKDWLLRPDNGKWLIVFDNVEPSLNILDFIPLTLTGKIIFTCQDKNSCPLGAEVPVGPLTPDQALKLMELTLGETLLDPAQVEAAQIITQHLAYHSRSILLAASTIRQRGMTVDEYYRQIMEKTPLRLIGSTIDESPVTRTILRISAMLSTSVIPVALFTAESELKQVPERFTSIFGEIKMFQDIGHVENVLHYLLDENIIQTPSSPTSSPTSSQTSYTSFDSFILDPEARDQVRTSLHPEDQIDHAWLACNMCVDGIRKQELDSSSLSEIHQFGRVMAPHAKTCYDDWSSVLGMRMNDDNIAWQVLGNVCMTQGALEQAIGCFELALSQKGSMDAIERIQTSLSLVSLLNQSGEHQRSRDTLAEIDIGDIDIALGFRVAMAKASAAAAQGELDRAEDQYNTLEHEQEEALGPTDVNTVGTVQRLASTLEQLGKLDEAQALYRRVYLSYQNIFGPAHPMTLEALEDLAHISKECNAIDEAESLYRQSVDIKMRTLGTQHPSTADTLQKLAVIDDLRCRYDDAATKYRRALDSMAPVLGRAHPLYTTTMENMALSSRWYGRSLYDSGDMDVKMSESSPTHERSRLRSRGSSSSSDSKKSSKQTAAEREAQRQTAFETAERLYLDVLGIKTAARDLYSNEQVLATGSKLCEMYDNERFFAEHKVAKVEDVMKLLRERGKGGGTALAVGSI